MVGGLQQLGCALGLGLRLYLGNLEGSFQTRRNSRIDPNLKPQP